MHMHKWGHSARHHQLKKVWGHRQLGSTLYWIFWIWKQAITNIKIETGIALGIESHQQNIEWNGIRLDELYRNLNQTVSSKLQTFDLGIYGTKGQWQWQFNGMEWGKRIFGEWEWKGVMNALNDSNILSLTHGKPLPTDFRAENKIRIEDWQMKYDNSN